MGMFAISCVRYCVTTRNRFNGQITVLSVVVLEKDNEFSYLSDSDLNVALFLLPQSYDMYS
jgi:hypothetical protein